MKMALVDNEKSIMKPKFKLGLTAKKNFSVDNVEELINDINNDTNSLPLEFASLSKLNEHINELIQNHVFLLFFELLKKISIDFKDKGISFDDLKNKYLSYFQNNMSYSQLFCDLLSANLETMDLSQLKQEIMNGKVNGNKQLFNEKTQNFKLPDDEFDNFEKNSSSTETNNTPESQYSKNDGSDSDDLQVDYTKCYARTANGKQCSRKKQKSQDFCGSHLHNQPHGRIDQALDLTKNKPKKRGRPPKNLQKQQILDPQQVNVVQMDVEIEMINGIEYIVDNNGNVYKIPDNFDAEEDVIDAEKLKLLGKKLPGDQIKWYSDTDLKFI